MNVTQIITELREERAALDEAIAVLERIARSGPRGRGRPPNWMSGTTGGGEGVAASPKRVFSAATKKKMADAQRRRWEAYRKAKEQV